MCQLKDVYRAGIVCRFKLSALMPATVYPMIMVEIGTGCQQQINQQQKGVHQMKRRLEHEILMITRYQER
jgi:hypothetical protein